MSKYTQLDPFSINPHQTTAMPVTSTPKITRLIRVYSGLTAKWLFVTTNSYSRNISVIGIKVEITKSIWEPQLAVYAASFMVISLHPRVNHVPTGVKVNPFSNQISPFIT